MIPATTARTLVAVAATLVAGAVQVSVLPFLAWHGVVPNLVLLVVVAVALSDGSELAMGVGFGAGLLLDLAPPADHVAGRWALALVAVGYVAGQVRSARPGLVTTATVVLASSFVGTSVVALTGVLLRDPAVGTGALLSSVGVAMVVDLLLAPLVLIPTRRALHRARWERALSGP